MSESEPRLIRGYLQVLASQLPASIVDELADGLTAALSRRRRPRTSSRR